MKILNIINIVIGTILIVLCVSFISMSGDNNIETLGNVEPFFSGVTNTKVVVSNVPTLVLSSNSGAQYRSITNSESNKISCSLVSASTSVTFGDGYSLNANGGNVEFIDGQNLYTGNIWCITSSGTSTASIVEK